MNNRFYKASPIEGISLIVLVITIIVIIILASAVILSLSQNNPISSASEATFRSDLSEIESQLNLYAANQYSKTNGSFDISTMDGKVSDFVPQITKYDSETLVVDGKLRYTGTDTTKIQISKSMGIWTTPVDVVAVSSTSFNKPDISSLPTATTKAITWDSSNNESQIDLTTANSSTSWYNYSNKEWANILTSNNNNKAYWVWIPRYAYKIDHPHTSQAEQIHIIFLADNTNFPADGSTLPSDYIVHPAFTFGSTQLNGIWVAKYEASSNAPDTVESGVGYTGGANNTSLQVNVLPDVYSWRDISTGNAQTVCMSMTSSTGSLGTSINLDTHLIKNIEWGAVAYLSQSQYGQEPWINPYGDNTSGSYKLKTGYSGESKDSSALSEGNSQLHTYNNATYGGKSSTTGNIYGIYDMSGGAMEFTAALLNNGDINIGKYGSIYVENNKIRPEYTKYYDIYEPGDEEKEDGQFYSVNGENLYNSVAPYNASEKDNNVIRKRLTDETYAKFTNRKGDALWETSNSTSYWGKLASDNEWQGYAWLIDTTPQYNFQETSGWNDDFINTGSIYLLWFKRGNNFNGKELSGLFAYYNTMGFVYSDTSFRPILITGQGI